ncbi:RNA polymerase II transcription factor B subunit 1 [Curvularia kusanoi]|uniref:RNA polymerase II transcription factor B subunit 1 n=1 Tax=Curvularia kusanoi TaxID=90978 RepID=A0A9P4TKD6_CURKU|nr:RNA polymerase II transcription factor B subunit 1 [Curvularia kusanoi]
MSSAAAQYKKKDGTISVSGDGKTVSWEAAGGVLPSLAIAIADIGNLQQTPATAAKASIKIVVVESSPQAGSHTFTFTSTNARDDQQMVRGLLQKGIEAAKAQETPVVTAAALAAAAAADAGGASSSMTMAQTVAATAQQDEDLYADAKLLADTELQRSLLNSSPLLLQRFNRALKDKPESVSVQQFNNQFWSTRLNLLRSHAAEKSQTTGSYNVLTVIKSRLEEGKLVLNLTKEQIELVFRQHPIVKTAYNELVPPLNGIDFWARFFESRLFKKLKGERIPDDYVTDAKLDKYLKYDENADNAQQMLVGSIPMFINIEGNEQNHSQQKGNRQDWTMVPSSNEKAPILRVLNRMSEKLMKEVPLVDNHHTPAGQDENTYKELQLRDLQRASDDNRVILKVQDQSRFFSAGQSLQSSTSASAYTKRTPTDVLLTLQRDLKSFDSRSKTSGIDLHSKIAVNDDSDSEDESGAPKKPRVGSRSTRTAAAVQIISAVQKRRLHEDEYPSAKGVWNNEHAAKLGISDKILDDLTMTHNTTVEFLHFFWDVYHSGNPERANEVAKLIETLDRSLDRINAVANAAEAERTTAVEEARRRAELFFQSTGKRKKLNTIKGGASAVAQLMQPLTRAIDAARTQYQSALNEQLALVAPSNGL